MSKDKLTDILINDEEAREQRIHELLKARKSLNINTEMSKTSTFGEQLSDKVAGFTGTWRFLLIFIGVIVLWGIINTEWLLTKPFDPFPYVFLNLVLACISSMQAPIIMMSQNRESQKDRLRAENDYLINQKSEIILEDLHLKIDDLLYEQKRLKKQLNDIMISMNSMGLIPNQTEEGTRSDGDGKVSTGGEKSGIYDRDNRTH